MKNSVTRFVLLSATVVSLLGCFKGDSCPKSFGVCNVLNLEAHIGALMQGNVATEMKPVEEPKREENRNFTFNFPNVFNIFRYLF